MIIHYFNMNLKQIFRCHLKLICCYQINITDTIDSLSENGLTFLSEG